MRLSGFAFASGVPGVPGLERSADECNLLLSSSKSRAVLAMNRHF